MNAVLKPLTALAAPAGPRSRLSVFYFHRVLAEPDPLMPSEPDARTFDRILGWIGSQFRVLDPLEACERLYDGSLPSRPAVVTFDDGYRDNFTVALPILGQRRMPAAFFVASGFLDGGMMFNDRVIEAVRRCAEDRIDVPGVSASQRASLPLRNLAERRAAIDCILAAVKHLAPELRDERVAQLERSIAGGTANAGTTTMMMTPDQVAGLHRAGMQIGGHTRSHPILVTLEDELARGEIEGGLADLAAITGERPALFAYPNGRRGVDFDSRHVGMLENAGLRYAFTTHAGAGSRDSAPHELPRFTPWDRSAFKFGTRACLNLFGRVH